MARKAGQSLSRSLNRIMLSFALLALLLVIGFWYQATIAVIEQASLHFLRELMASVTTAESRLFKQAEHNVSQLHQELLSRLDKSDPVVAEQIFYQKFARGDDGLWRVKPFLDDHQNLPSLYIQHDAELSSSLFMRAVTSYHLLAERGPAIVPPYYSVYMDFVEKGLMVYSPFVNWGQGATRETDNFNYPTMMGSNPANNPSRTSFWTPVYFDEEAKIWMVSVIEPLDWRGEWVGTVGHDVSIEHLVEETLHAQIAGTYNILLSGDAKLIAHPDYVGKLSEQKGELDIELIGDPLLTRIDQLARDQAVYPAVIEDPVAPLFYGVAKLQGPGWLLVTVYPKTLAMTQARQALWLPAIIAILFVVVAMLLLQRRIYSEIMKPLGHLDTAVAEIASGQPNVSIPISGAHEYGRLARSFESLSRLLTQREASLIEEKTNWKLTFESVLELIVIVDTNYKIIQGNQSFFDTYNARGEDMVGKNRIKLVSPENQVAFTELYERALHDGKVHHLSTHSQRLHIDYEVSLVPLLKEDGRVDRFVEIGRDVTERRRLETQLRQSQKMDAVGQLAGGVAHDFNNLLQIILGYAESLEATVPDGVSAAAVKQILSAGEKASSLTQQLLAFSRRQVMQPEVIEIGDLLASAVTLVERLIGSNIQIAFERKQGCWNVEVDQNLIEQVIINLCLNSRDAMPEGGTLKLGYRECATDNLPDGLKHKEAQYVEFWVTDSGVGIEQAHLELIFEPFFSTKDINKGTGLGLATAYGIIEQHGGAMKVTSEIDAGTTVSVFLPTVDKNVSKVDADSEVQEMKTAGEFILVAEDDEMIRTLLQDGLSAQGYRVLMATNGAEALSLFRQHENQIDLVLLDMMMPELSGDQVLAAIRKVNAGIPCLIASGYSETQALKQWENDENTGFVSKPFRLQALFREIHAVLNR